MEAHRLCGLSVGRLAYLLHIKSDKATDVMFLLRWPIIALILAALYHLMVLIGGGMFYLRWLLLGVRLMQAENYNVIPRALDSMSWRVREAGGRVL